MERILDIRLLGSPVIRVNGAPLEVDTRKAIAILAYLTVEETSTRDSLATLFWQDASQERARATLRRTLSSLRTAIGPETLDADRLRVSLRGPVRSDIADFTSELEATKSHNHQSVDVCADCIPHLELATALYGEISSRVSRYAGPLNSRIGFVRQGKLFVFGPGNRTTGWQ